MDRFAVDSEILPKGDILIVRQFITSGASFKRRNLETAEPNDELVQATLAIHLPHFIWVAELSSETEYKRFVCRVQIVIDATAHPKEKKAVIYSRVGDWFVLKKGWKLKNANTLYPLYTNNLGSSKPLPS